MTPVNIKEIPKNKNELKAATINSLKKNPKSAAGIVAIIKYNQIFLACLLKVNNSTISFLVNINIAKIDAICNIVIKNKLGSFIKLENKAKCPDEDTGRNSVIACIIAKIISFMIFYSSKV